MRWEKLGKIFEIKEQSDLLYSHAMTPVPIHLEGDVYRIIFNSRTKDNISRPFSVDINILTHEIIQVNTSPILELGDVGGFDECGIVISSVLPVEDKLYIYYLGFPRIAANLFTASIGLAISSDLGLSAKKLYPGPIKGILKNEAYFSTGPRVIYDEDMFKMWYASCLRWENTNGKLKHFYHIKYCESPNGIDWGEGVPAIDFENEYEYALSIPSIVKDRPDLYNLWFTFRAQKNVDTYRIGHCTSKDGKTWSRSSIEDVGIDVSPSGWDSEMICFPHIIDHCENRYMLYNGNEYGKTGFGIAKLIE